VSRVDGFNFSSRDDKAPLVELAVVLFFLVDILGFFLEPNTNVGANCCGVAKLPSQIMKGKKRLENQNSDECKRGRPKSLSQQ
jgi:hypothetical protein